MVNRLLSEHHVSGPPVDVSDIAEKEGARIVRNRLEDDLAGFVLRTGGKLVIGVNDRHNENRQRFTIAHELGHALLHDVDDVHVDHVFRFRSPLSAQAVDKDEIEANAFAASLLMPRNMLTSRLQGIEIDVEDETLVRKLAEEFKVSRQAMSFRLLNVFPSY